MLKAYWPLSNPALVLAIIGIGGVLADAVTPVAADVAVMVTVLGLGGVAGAVYVVATPVSVLTGLNEPQGFVPVPPVQVTLQFTPDGGVVSFAMVAVKLAVLPASMEVGIVELIVTVSMGGTIVTGLDMVGFGAACA